MRKLLGIALLVFVFTLSGCKAEDRQVQKQLDNHYDSIDDYDYVEIKTSVTSVIDGKETVLESFMYVDNTVGKTCVAMDENDPSGFTEYSVECIAIYGIFNSEPAGFVPFIDSGIYPVHPIYETPLFEDDIVGYLTDEDVLEETDTTIRYRVTVDYDDLGNELLQTTVTSGMELDFYEIPVIFNLTYDKDLKMFTSIVIDNTDIMAHLYQTNFGYDINMEQFSISYEYSEYTDELSFFYPTTDYKFDEDVNYFTDGDYYGYREFFPGEVIEGELDYDSDQDLMVIYAPTGGLYNFTYESSSYEESILFALYSSEYELLYEGVVEEADHELQDLYMASGKYYVLFFTHHTADGYKLLFDKVQ